MLNATIAATAKGRRWWQIRHRESTAHKHGRVLYLEVVYNLLLCRFGQRGTPPMLFLTCREWNRPSTRDVLVQLLPVQELLVVASPYLMMDAYELLFGQPRSELLLARWTGQDIVVLGQLVDEFAAAERALRNHLYSAKGQTEIGQVLGQMISEPPRISWRLRASNTLAAIPFSWRLVAFGAWAGVFGWRLWAPPGVPRIRRSTRRAGSDTTEP